ncbi:hypothetical protein KC324_g37 [Hortaea werneckii]|nr:hypothetical protein KC324_g37 [Hortaea werneckii]
MAHERRDPLLLQLLRLRGPRAPSLTFPFFASSSSKSVLSRSPAVISYSGAWSCQRVFIRLWYFYIDLDVTAKVDFKASGIGADKSLQCISRRHSTFAVHLQSISTLTCSHSTSKLLQSILSIVLEDMLERLRPLHPIIHSLELPKILQEMQDGRMSVGRIVCVARSFVVDECVGRDVLVDDEGRDPDAQAREVEQGRSQVEGRAMAYLIKIDDQ